MTRRRWLGAAAALAALALAAAHGCERLGADPAWRRDVAALAGGDVTALRYGASRPLRWERRFAVPAPWREVGDLASTPAGLVAAASTDALTEDGATLFRWDARGGLRELLRWDGQGFLRVHAFGRRLLVPDADAPFRAVPFLFDLDVDGYVFVSDAEGGVAERSREVLPAVYHVFDVARLAGGRAVASTGAYPPAAVAYLSSRAPAALFADDGPGRPWRRALEWPSPDAEGVWRFTYLLALDDGALLAGAETPRGPGAVRIDDPLGGARVATCEGVAGFVLRLAQGGARVLAVEQGAGATRLLASYDGGRRFTEVAGAPAMPESVAVAGGALYVLAAGALYVERGGAFERLTEPHAALGHRPSALVSAPLVAHEGSLWSASPATGEVFEAVEAGR